MSLYVPAARSRTTFFPCRFVVCFLLATCSTLGASETKRILATELELVSLQQGDRIEIVARYQSLLGTTLKVEDCEAEFEIDSDREYPALFDPDLRNIQLMVRCVRSAPTAGGAVRFRVEEIQKAPAPLELFRDLLAVRPATPSWHCDLLAWALETANTKNLPELDQAARTHFEQLLKKLLAAPPSADTGAGALSLLESTHPFEGDAPEWQALLLSFADRYGDRPPIAARLEVLGYMLGSGGWRRENELLEEAGLTRLGGRITTLRNAQLESRLRVWAENRTAPELLRGLTDSQYRQHARVHAPKPGMNRSDVLAGWGYPEQVTWIRRDYLFESWTVRTEQTTHTFYFVEGFLFAWQ
ncbi:MAG: hypothetical protein ACKVX7_01520 [Planctomycetota bacterium]